MTGPTDPPDNVASGHIIHVESKLDATTLQEWAIVDYVDCQGTPCTVYFPRSTPPTKS
jgi:hypothetical protein